MDIEQLKENSQIVSEILKVLGHPKRLLILCFISQGQHTVQELEKLCSIGQSQISQFLKRMELQGLINSTKDGRFVIYQITDPRVKELIQSLHKIFC